MSTNQPSSGTKIPPEKENPIDNILINISFELGKIFRKCPYITPNVITTMSLVVTLVGCWYLHSCQYKLAAVLIFVGYFFDCMDGNFARTYNMVSTNGDLYDHISDVMKHVIIFVVLYRSSLSINTLKFFALCTVVFTIMILIHAGCQEKNKDAKYTETTVLSYAKPFCVDPSWIYVTRWGGFGTLYMLTCVIIYNLQWIDSKLGPVTQPVLNI